METTYLLTLAVATWCAKKIYLAARLDPYQMSEGWRASQERDTGGDTETLSHLRLRGPRGQSAHRAYVEPGVRPGPRR